MTCNTTQHRTLCDTSPILRNAICHVCSQLARHKFYSWRRYPVGTCSMYKSVNRIGVGRDDVIKEWVDRDHRDRDPQRTDLHSRRFENEAQKRRRFPSSPVQSVSVRSRTRYESVRRPTYGTINAKRGATEQKTGESSTTKVVRSVTIGIKQSDAETHHLATSTSAPGAETLLMVLKIAVLRRRRKPLTLLVANQWKASCTHFIRAQSTHKYWSTYDMAHTGIPKIQRHLINNPPERPRTLLMT